MKHLFLLLLFSGAALAAEPVSRGLLAPPPHFRFVEVQGKSYYRGTVSLEAAADTVLLKPFGFRNLEFLGRGFRSVRYAALWPQSTPLDSLPLQVVSITYDAELAVRPHLFLYFGWPGPNVRHIPTGANLEALRDARFRYAVPKDGVGNVTVNGKPYVTGRIALWDAADTTRLKPLGICQFYPPTFEEQIDWEDLPPNYSSHWLTLQQFHCRWPVTLDVHSMPEFVIDMASDIVLRHHNLSLKRLYRVDLETAGATPKPKPKGAVR